MKALAKAILNLAAFLELSSDEAVDPDAAVAAMEQLAADLQAATPAELEYIRATIRQEIVEVGDDRTLAQAERIEFLLDFMEDFGLEKD